MVINPVSKPTENEDEILIMFLVEGIQQVISGWYDQHEQDFYSYDGELIDGEIFGWTWQVEYITG